MRAAKGRFRLVELNLMSLKLDIPSRWVKGQSSAFLIRLEVGLIFIYAGDFEVHRSECGRGAVCQDCLSASLFHGALCGDV